MQRMLHRLKVGKERVTKEVDGVVFCFCQCGGVMVFWARLIAGLTAQ
jgi:hypothetical protein